MKSYLIALCICCAALASVPAVAGTIELPASGQTSCYDATGTGIACAGTGQDADLLAGIRWPDPRFTDNGDGTIMDNLTGLMWLEDANCLKTQYSGVDADGLVYWQDALDFVIGINDGTYFDCQYGHTDWRLPNINELKSLVDFGQSPKALPALHPFDDVRNTYWSSTTHANDLTNAYGVQMDEGRVSSFTKLGGAFAAIWPVRDSGNVGKISLPKTRQTTCHDDGGNPIIPCSNTGQDGEFQKGVAWPEPRFTDNGDGTVTDELTGLIWLGDAQDCMGGTQLWTDTLVTVADLNENPANYHAIVTCDYTGTYSDWRLANIQELESIVHYAFTEEGAYNSTSEWLNDLGVGFDTASSLYWTSTSYAGSPDDAHAYYMSAINAGGILDKDSTPYDFWPVRGGVYGDPDISVSPTTVDFGSVTVGTSATKDITVTNDGTYYLEVDATAELAAPFSIVNDGCANQMVAPGGTCTITAGYDPTTENADSGNANVTSDDPDEATVVVSLSGTGTATPNNPPSAFELVYPNDGATGLGTTVTMIWKAATDPDGGTLNYDITYCADSEFAGCTALENIASIKIESPWLKFAKGWITSLVTGPFSLMGCGGSATTSNDAAPALNADELSYTAMDLTPGTTYYWKVTANDADGGATESEARSFTTQ